MIDLKVVNSVLEQLEEERGITKEKIVEAIEEALAHAYKKEYGKRSQIVKAHFAIETGEATFEQVKVVVDDSTIYTDEEEDRDEDDERERFDAERHIFLEDAQKIKKDADVGDEVTFPLEAKEDFGRIAAQTAKQVMIQKIREAEKAHLSEEFSKREGEIVTGTVQRIERGNIYVDLGRATGLLPYEEQIPGERYKQGERIRAYLYSVEETSRGIFLRLSRSHPDFLEKLFALESPEVASEVVEIRAIAREAGSRSKVAVWSNDDHVDPVGSLVGQRGVRVSTVMSELGGEKIDIVEYSDEPTEFIEEALSPASIVDVEVTDEEEQQAIVRVSEDQQSLAIGRGGQNVRLAAKLTGWRIDIQSVGGETVAEADEEGEVELVEETDNEQPSTDNKDSQEKEEEADDTEDENEDPKAESEDSDQAREEEKSDKSSDDKEKKEQEDNNNSEEEDGQDEQENKSEDEESEEEDADDSEENEEESEDEDKK